MIWWLKVQYCGFFRNSHYTYRVERDYYTCWCGKLGSNDSGSQLKRVWDRFWWRWV